MKLKLIFFFAYFACINATPETNTKKCGESSFCRRCRKPQSDSEYQIELDSLIINDYGMQIEISNNASAINRLVLKLECLESNTFHFEVDEKSPIKPRFRVTEVITHDLVKRNAQVTTDSTSVNVTCGGVNKAIVNNNPFLIEFYRGSNRVVTVNKRNLMRFEHLRLKPQEKDENEDVDAWDETWEDYTDSKPNGPEAVALDFTFDQSELLFGIPEHHDTFALKPTLYGEPYRLYTVDVTFYDLESKRPNYGVIPVIYGHGSSGQSVGMFWHNSADTYVDIYDEKTSHFMSEGGIFDVFVFLGPSPNEVFAQYTKITGVTNLPQLFTLAYHQCRWSYKTQSEVLDIVDNFDKHDIPLDTMWLDIDYTDGKRYFTWNYTAFPQPLELMAELKSMGRHLVHIIDPHIKVDSEYRFYAENKEKNFFIKNRDGDDFEGLCWPGMSSYVDFLNPTARKFYADQYLLENFTENAVENGIWNDMNEPTVFDASEKTLPRDAVHINGIEHRLVHNTYGYMQTMGTYDGVMRRGNSKYRPFILTRSFFAGSQKYTAVWTGDNIADWGYLLASIQVCLAISVSGISFCGADIGGFFGDPEEELFIRWTQAAAFQPFFRNHASSGTKYREPWTFSEEALNISRESIRKRYQFLPMWYTLFYEHEITGIPVMQPMLSQYPIDKNAFKLETQFMLSDKLLVRPVLERSTTWVIVYFPIKDNDGTGDIWYDVDNYEKYEQVGTVAINAPIDKTPVFQRGGTIIPKKMEAKKSSVLMRDDPYCLYIAIDKNFSAEGTLYYDDETSFNYRDKNDFDYLHFKFVGGSLEVHPMMENYNKIKFDKIFYAGLTYTPTTATFICRSSSVETELDSSKIHVDSENLLHVDVSSFECDYSWTLRLNGSMKNILRSGLLLITLFVHFVKNFF